MLASELRYLGSNLAVFTLIAISFGASFYIGITAHLHFPAVMLLIIVLMSASGFAGFAVWSRNRGLFQPTTKARYAPLLFPLAVLGFDAYLIASIVALFRDESSRVSGGISLLVLCMSAGSFASTTLKDWRLRYLQAGPPPEPAFAQEPLER